MKSNEVEHQDKEEKRILIVEDDQSTRELLEYKLMTTLEGPCEIFFAAGERKALQILKKIDIDIALVDSQLIDGSGLGVLLAIKGDEKTKNIEVIMTPTKYDSRLFDTCLQAGAANYIFKSSDWLNSIGLLVKRALFFRRAKGACPYTKMLSEGYN